MQYKVRQNLLQIQEDIAPYKPNIIAVTKYFDESAIIDAYNAGLRDFAESRVVEAVKKIDNLPSDIKDNSRFHFIGHLQTNKVRKVVGKFDYIHSVDSLRLAEVISEEAQNVGKIQQVLLEVNIAEEDQKYGFSEDEIIREFASLKKLPGINIAGLMCMTPLGASEKTQDEVFKKIVSLKESLENMFDCELKELSMGMSQDYKEAAKFGATMLRIGSKLFN